MPPSDTYSGTPFEAALACAAASETPSRALAPSRDLFGVPSRATSSAVEPLLVGGELPMTASAISVVDVGDGLEDALAAVALGVAVAQLVRFVGAGAGAGRHDGAPRAAVFERDLDLDGRVAARVEHLEGAHCCDAVVSHGVLLRRVTNNR